MAESLSWIVIWPAKVLVSAALSSSCVTRTCSHLPCSSYPLLLWMSMSWNSVRAQAVCFALLSSRFMRVFSSSAFWRCANITDRSNRRCALAIISDRVQRDSYRKSRLAKRCPIFSVTAVDGIGLWEGRLGPDTEVGERDRWMEDIGLWKGVRRRRVSRGMMTGWVRWCGECCCLLFHLAVLSTSLMASSIFLRA